MKIYTRTGDGGETGLFAGARVPKDDARIEAIGSVDELNASLGWARARGLPSELDAALSLLQHELFAVGAELASPNPVAAETQGIGARQIQRLEQTIDEQEQQLEPLRNFILPGGTEAAAALHLARAVCRRAERRLITLRRCSPEPVSADLVCYLNRVGDLLFVLARRANALANTPDVRWQRET